MGIQDKIGNNRIVIPKEEADKMHIAFGTILGTTQILNGSQLVYDFYQQVHHGAGFLLDLETGGENDPIIAGGKCNWFPGCYTYGFVLEQDAPVYDNEDGIVSADHILTTVYRKDEYHTYEESSVKILTVLDNVNTNRELQKRLKIYYKVKTNDGIIGYIYSPLINKIVYKDC